MQPASLKAEAKTVRTDQEFSQTVSDDLFLQQSLANGVAKIESGVSVAFGDFFFK